MASWDPIGAIGGVIGAAAGVAALGVGYFQVRSLIQPKVIKCEVFDWQDIDPGHEMHECRGASCGWRHSVSVHGPAEACWGGDLGSVFSRSWSRSARRGRRLVRQPAVLSPERRYICTDAMTIKAFVLCSAGCARERVEFHSQAAFSPDDLRFDGTHVHLRELVGAVGEKIVVAHVQGPVGVSLTKGDVEGILWGYPPWYRESILLRNGGKVPSPIRSNDDVYRAGWVVGVGLSTQQPLLAAPRRKIFMEKPIVRLHQVLEHKISPAFPGEANISTIIDAVQQMIDQHSESGIFPHLWHPDGREADEDAEIERLDPAQAHFIMGIFNSPPSIPLTDEEIARVEPILIPLLHAAHRGAHLVVKALKNATGLDFERLGWGYWPEPLRDLKQRVYVEDCAHQQ